MPALRSCPLRLFQRHRKLCASLFPLPFWIRFMLPIVEALHDVARGPSGIEPFNSDAQAALVADLAIS